MLQPLLFSHVSLLFAFLVAHIKHIPLNVTLNEDFAQQCFQTLHTFKNPFHFGANPALLVSFMWSSHFSHNSTPTSIRHHLELCLGDPFRTMFLLPSPKQAKKVDIMSPLLAVFQGPTPPSPSTLRSAKSLQTLRSAIHMPPTNLATAAALRKYLSALFLLRSYIPDLSKLHVTLLWTNSLDVEDSMLLSDLSLDRLGTLFNLATTHASIAASAHMATAEQCLTKSITHFRHSASWFTQAASGWRPTSCSEDTQVDALLGLAEAMLGNAQQVFYEYVRFESKKGSPVVATAAAGTRDCYRRAAELFKRVGGKVWSKWGVLCDSLAIYYEAVGMVKMAEVYHDGAEIALEMRQLINAVAVAGRAVESVGRVQEEVQVLREESGKLLTEAKRKYDSAVEYNRKLILAEIAASVPVVEGRASCRIKQIEIEEEMKEVENLLQGFKR